MKILKFILDILIDKSVDEQEQEYLKKYGYPDESVIFTDRRGRISRLIGKNEFIEVANSDWYKKIEAGIKEKGYFKIDSL